MLVNNLIASLFNNYKKKYLLNIKQWKIKANTRQTTRQNKISSRYEIIFYCQRIFCLVTTSGRQWISINVSQKSSRHSLFAE